MSAVLQPDEHPDYDRFLFWVDHTLKLYDIDQTKFRKPRSALDSELWKGEGVLRKVIHQGKHRIVIRRKAALIDLTHFDFLTRKKSRFGEVHRVLPGKPPVVDVRFGKEKFLRETVRSDDVSENSTNGFETALRGLIEEAGIKNPKRELLLPAHHFHSYDVARIPGAVQYAGQSVRTLTESKAFPGLLSMTFFHEYQYHAEERGPDEYESTDEYGVITLGRWDEVES